MTDERIRSATHDISADAATVFELIADPARQPDWDGNDNLAELVGGGRIHGVGETFSMRLTNDAVRDNQVVEFDEGRLIAWLPSEPGKPSPGHLWRWEIESIDDTHVRVTHTYDWTELTDPGRMERARTTTAERLRASIDNLAKLAEQSH
ncbi:SRPBCC family protein [Gordonia sp. DT219]|uniref:SRPBCC family protein n=1 Tax=Gordonia sp. DT219 TaxID=3416658 RepID=UPI003CEB497D